MSNFRALSHLPWPVRIAVTAPMLIALVYFQYAAYTGQRSMEEGLNDELVATHKSKKRPHGTAAVAPHHDEGAYYPSEHAQPTNESSMWAWTAVAAGGTALAVLATGFAFFTLTGGWGDKEDPEAVPPQLG